MPQFSIVRRFFDLLLLNQDSCEILAQDEAKSRACKEAGITLISVPYWWDKNASWLAAAIHNVRPDIPLSLASSTKHSTTNSAAVTTNSNSGSCAKSLDNQRIHSLLESKFIRVACSSSSSSNELSPQSVVAHWHHNIDPSNW